MCRFVAYLGEAVLLDRVLVKPTNSIVMQSLHAREAKEVPTNGDGFGIGWYAPMISVEPALFTSIFPAWSDMNLLHLTAKIQSPCFFGHVRAATTGGINPYNCHPFIFGRWMLMHNGEIPNFVLVKRHLRHLLDDDIYHWIQGETDSEHFFALLLQLSRGKNVEDMNVVVEVLLQTIATIEELVQTYSSGGVCYFNLCLTDGERIIATRYCTGKHHTPSSLHYLVGYGDADKPLKPKKHKSQQPTFVLVSSEQLTHWDTGWHRIPTNHLLMVHATREIELREM